ncbi:cobalamin-binding protein [Falsibacillus albus]|uniref:Cobalamin-binding protein n=1 Tax=Falsibacillus albus TaxID=2478915 RepID=A0A3L7K0C7_9BACI|nr:cobalamin-binding protein [Falsibacillus albus]RLQ96517.1 cobalamin-binding protein [Falsibacillus albus]
MRLISICPSNTEIIAYLGLTSSLVGIDDFSDWPLSIQHLPKLGPDLSIRMDDLEKLQPDLVLASLSVPGMEKNIEELKKRGIPHIVLNPQSLEDILNDIRLVGQLCNVENKALEVVDDFKRTIEECKNACRSVHYKPTLYWEWWPKPVFTPGRINWLTEVSKLAGGLNLFSDVELASIQTDWDDVFQRNPDHICLAWVGVAQNKVNTALVRRRPNWDRLEAVKKKHIHVLEEALYCRPSPRLLEGIVNLGKILHPDIYMDIKLPPSLQS